MLDRDELRGVLAHELSHVKNRDILIGSVAAAVALAITFVARIAFWGALFGGGSDGDGGNAFGALLMLILARSRPGCCRCRSPAAREYQADESGAHLLHDGEPLARALEKIEAYAKQVPMDVQPGAGHGLHREPAHRAQGGVRQPVQHAPADRRAHPAPAFRAVLSDHTLARCRSGGRGPASSSASSLPHW